MVDEIHLNAGEFSTLVRFTSQPDRLLDGVSLAVFDENTNPLLAPSLERRQIWPAGEASKSWVQVENLLKTALAAELGRDSVIAGVGGGVVTDMAAFAASLYMRGTRLVLVPTTLLAMVDAALGGKTGIDFGGFKNLVGTFYPASEIRIWPGFLATLPHREFQSGLAEVIKHAFLADEALLSLLETRSDAVLAKDPAVLDEVVRRAIMVKVGVVERDLRETGERAFLNLGHTFGHALEAALGLDGRWTHGEAVAWGMARAFRLGVRLGITEPAWQKRAESILIQYGFPLLNQDATAEAVLAAMKNDKKKKSGLVQFVLQQRQGQTLLRTVDDADVLAVIKEGLECQTPVI